MKTMEDIEILFPASLAEALAMWAVAGSGCRLLAGGTDLMVQWASGVLPVPECAISLMALDELKTIRDAGHALEIGALVTHAQLRASPLVQQHLPSLAAAAATVGGVQIQNRGTLGGNVANASPAGDLAPSLLITGGTVVAASQPGERLIPLTAFFQGYRKIDLRSGELLARFILPKKSGQARECFKKIGPRAMQAISKVMGACRAEIKDGTIQSMAIALGSVAATPVRLTGLEQWLVGRPLDAPVIDEAEKRTSASVKPIDDIRSTAEYRKWVSGRIIRGFLESLLVQNSV
ncbi:MAG: xanthine dehydrogenase family protein subunit M [Lentisphaerota bacterium]